MVGIFVSIFTIIASVTARVISRDTLENFIYPTSLSVINLAMDQGELTTKHIVVSRNTSLTYGYYGFVVSRFILIDLGSICLIIIWYSYTKSILETWLDRASLNDVIPCVMAIFGVDSFQSVVVTNKSITINERIFTAYFFMDGERSEHCLILATTVVIFFVENGVHFNLIVTLSRDLDFGFFLELSRVFADDLVLFILFSKIFLLVLDVSAIFSGSGKTYYRGVV